MTNTYHKKGVNGTLYPKVMKAGTAYKKLYVEAQDPYPNYMYVENVSNENGIFAFTKNNDPSSVIQYSYDRENWTSVSSTTTISIDADQKIYLKGNNPNGISAAGDVYNEWLFNSNKIFNAGGNILSLLFADTFESLSGIVLPGGMHGMFANTNIVSAADLDFSGIAEIYPKAFEALFINCTQLTTPPSFSTIVRLIKDNSINSWGGNMNAMFEGCSSLTTPADLSGLKYADAQYSLSGVFKRCTSLTEGPNITNIENLGDRCLGDFFSGCTSLTKAYAPTLSSWNSNNTTSWLNGVAASGTLYADASIASTIPTNSASGCPTGWSIVTI